MGEEGRESVEGVTKIEMEDVCISLSVTIRGSFWDKKVHNMAVCISFKFVHLKKLNRLTPPGIMVEKSRAPLKPPGTILP